MALASHEHWSSRFGFLMAAIGFAVGLGNIWRFPYVTGENGGGAFVVVYLLCAVLIGAPILMAEIFIGRRGAGSPPSAMGAVATESGRSPHWRLVGYVNLVAVFTIMVVYCVIAGWVLRYLLLALATGFDGVDTHTAQATFDAMLADVPGLLLWTALGLALTGSIIFAGVRDGIERAVRWLMPLLFLLLIVLAIYNVFAGGFDEAVQYLFTPDFSRVNGAMVLAAVGQAFFSIGVAMAGMMTFGAYLPKHISIPRSVGIIILADTLVAIVAGLVIFPAVFHNGLDPQGGTGLIFHTLPVAFGQMPGGHFVGTLFFLLLAVAAITSMVGGIEPLVLWLEEVTSLGRHKSAIALFVAVALLSTVSVLAYGVWANVNVFGYDLNTVLDFVPNQVLLPLGGFLIALFAGWFVSRAIAREELSLNSARLFAVWRFLIRWPVPAAVALIFIIGVA
jgi:NSS family neurotransmitter:Na+ symporter